MCSRLFFPVAALGLGACQLATARAETVPRPQDSGLLPTATRALVLQFEDTEGPSLAEVARELEQVTGLHLVTDDPTRVRLEQTATGLSGSVEVPPQDVYPFAEGLLWAAGFVLRPIHAGDTPLLLLSANGRAGGSSERSAVFVEASQVRAFAARHPALVVQTVVDVRPLDARQASTSLRGLASDTNTQAILAVSESSLILKGTGRFLLEVLSSLDGVVAIAREPRTDDR